GLQLALSLCVALGLGTLAPGDAAAQDYPNRTITMIVPFAAGGLTDVPARILAAMMQERIGQSIVVEDKPGGSGTGGRAYAVWGRLPTATRCSQTRCPTCRTSTSCRYRTTPSTTSR